MSASNFCCTHPQQRVDSPEPPARHLASLDGIFAAAALPEDHPHALKFADKKPELDPSIVRSPNFTSKIKLQFRRKSMKSLGKEKDYDEDAHRITSREVLEDVEKVPSEDGDGRDAVNGRRFGSTDDLNIDVPGTGDTATPQFRTSLLRSLEYLKPLLQKSFLSLSGSSNAYRADVDLHRPSESTAPSESYNLVDVATRVATRKALAAASSENDCPFAALPKSISSPMLLQDAVVTPMRPRRSRSDYDLVSSLTMPKLRDHAGSYNLIAPNDLEWPTTGRISVADTHKVEVPILHVQEPTNTDSTKADERRNGAVTDGLDREPEALSVDAGYHLHKMDISQQLRCMSQLSDVAEDDSKPASPYPWNFHLRERSDVNSGRSRHSRQKSSSGIDSATVPSTWGRVRSPIRDATSSIYSRPTSAGANAADQNLESDAAPYETPVDLNALFAGWPLKPSPSAEVTHRKLRTVSERSAGSERRNKPLPPTPGGSRKDSDSASFVTADNKDEKLSVTFLSIPQRAGSIKSSSSIASKESRQSKFLERFSQRFSPPKKLVRKRRSIFKFLRPASRKQQGRSISTPVLGAKSPKPADAYDGTSDDPSLLMVQYELPEQPSNATRSMSMSHLRPNHHTDAASQLTAPSALQRRPTLADYERNLSVVGDDRRRPSAVNIHRVKEIQEEDRRESAGVRRRLSRAHPLKDDASPLMAQALEKHQQEKALFRSASKQRESLKSSQPLPVFGSLPFGKGEDKVQANIADDHSDLLDPLEKGHLGGASGRSLSVAHLAPPEPSMVGLSRRGSVAVTSRAPSTKASSVELTTPASAPQKSRIGTSLESWSRYPSHTRAERCGSAGRADAVITRDFAIDINPEEIYEIASPGSKHTAKSTEKHPKALPKTRSMTFSGIVRYYSNLFHTSGFSGQNRRTSITTGGRLEYPELEMLSPQLPTELSSQHRRSHGHQLERLKEHVKEDADKIKHYVKDEEDKFEGYMRQEEDQFEHFVRKEEDKFEGFMRKEEHKLKSYVKDEEDKLMHHRHNRSSEHDSSGRDSPFREVSVFGVSRDHSQEQRRRRDTMIGPTDSPDEEPPQVQGEGTTDPSLHLDGTGSTEAERKITPSKAEVWSDIYQECLAQTSTDVKAASKTTAEALEHDKQAKTMPPPILKPVKSRSPEHAKKLDPKATIRRFPSVTVIDDRKGHFRSVSLISIKTGKSTTFERTSTHDLLELVQAREREEREKLLRGIEDRNAVPVDG